MSMYICKYISCMHTYIESTLYHTECTCVCVCVCACVRTCVCACACACTSDKYHTKSSYTLMGDILYNI